MKWQTLTTIGCSVAVIIMYFIGGRDRLRIAHLEANCQDFRLRILKLETEMTVYNVLLKKHEGVK